MADDKKSYPVRVPIGPARPLTPSTTEEQAIEDHNKYHLPPKKDEVVNERQTSWPWENYSAGMKDQSGNSVTITAAGENPRTGQPTDVTATLRCRDGRLLKGPAVERAMSEARDVTIRDIGIITSSSDYTQPDGSPLERVCRVDHNARKHGGREPE